MPALADDRDVLYKATEESTQWILRDIYKLWDCLILGRLVILTGSLSTSIVSDGASVCY